VSKPRVLLLEDDASLRRFVRMALEELPLELLECDSVACALQILQEAQVQLIFTDLMLAGESGQGFLQRLKANPTLQGSAKVVVVSAGLSPIVRKQLETYPVWRVLEKPVSVMALERCVREVLFGWRAEGAVTGEELETECSVQDPLDRSLPTLTADESRAVALYFEGDAELFVAYRTTCLGQLPTDVREADIACRDADSQALMRVAHSLKTVLETLGYSDLSLQARKLEGLTLAEELQQATVHWAELRTRIQGISANI
jgi:CheY-like chemotaxis protein